MSEGSGVAKAGEQSNSSFFDRFAGRSAEFVSRASFFTFCVLLVLWVPPYFLLGNFDTYQLIINTPTTIITFLVVALLQNTQKRNEQALQHKLNAVAEGLADLMELSVLAGPHAVLESPDYEDRAVERALPLCHSGNTSFGGTEKDRRTTLGKRPGLTKTRA